MMTRVRVKNLAKFEHSVKLPLLLANHFQERYAENIKNKDATVTVVAMTAFISLFLPVCQRFNTRWEYFLTQELGTRIHLGHCHLFLVETQIKCHNFKLDLITKLWFWNRISKNKARINSKFQLYVIIWSKKWITNQRIKELYKECILPSSE